MGSILQKYTVIDIVKRIVQLKALKIDNGYPIRYHIWISPKNDISWWNRTLLGMENSLKPGDDHMGQVFCLRHGGFDRISAGCRARDRVGPKGGSRWSAFSHFVGYFFFTFLALTVLCGSCIAILVSRQDYQISVSNGQDASTFSLC